MLTWLYLYEQEQHESTDSRPKFCEGEEQSPDAYGEAMAILAGLDREFAFNNPAAPTTTVAPKPHVDGKDPRYISTEMVELTNFQNGFEVLRKIHQLHTYVQL